MYPCVLLCCSIYKYRKGFLVGKWMLLNCPRHLCIVLLSWLIVMVSHISMLIRVVLDHSFVARHQIDLKKIGLSYSLRFSLDIVFFLVNNCRRKTTLFDDFQCCLEISRWSFQVTGLQFSKPKTIYLKKSGYHSLKEDLLQVCKNKTAS